MNCELWIMNYNHELSIIPAYPAPNDAINREFASTSEPWENEDDKVEEG